MQAISRTVKYSGLPVGMMGGVRGRRQVICCKGAGATMWAAKQGAVTCAGLAQEYNFHIHTCHTHVPRYDPEASLDLSAQDFPALCCPSALAAWADDKAPCDFLRNWSDVFFGVTSGAAQQLLVS